MLRIVTEPADWTAVLGGLGRPSVMAGPVYARAAAALEAGGTAELAVWEAEGHRLAHPYVRRPVPLAPDESDLISVFDFGGFWFSTDDPAARAALLAGFEPAFAAHCRDAGIVSAFVRFHPFQAVDPAAFRRFTVWKFFDNVVVPLDRAMGAIRRDYAPSRRHKVRQGGRYAPVIDRSADYGPFLNVYHANLDRLNADPFYYFPLSFFDAVREHLDLFYLHDTDGRLCAAHTYLRDGDTVFAFLCHSDADTLEVRPNDVLFDHAIEHYAARGFRCLHLGGGSPTLTHYKGTFSPRRVPYFLGRAVFDDARYGDLTRRRAAIEGMDPDAIGFFPAYRCNERNAAAVHRGAKERAKIRDMGPESDED
ncbi:MAG: GNAT family N-acetyltransferase [Rhodobacterales bacterium]|nr:GNAT family N-acetyltransferase [Rhodobacterales bacterium]